MKIFKVENQLNPLQIAYVVAKAHIMVGKIMKGITSIDFKITDSKPLENYPGIVDKMNGKSGVYMNSIPPF